MLDPSVTEGNELDFVPSDWKPGDSVVWKQRNEVPFILDKPLTHSQLLPGWSPASCTAGSDTRIPYPVVSPGGLPP